MKKLIAIAVAVALLLAMAVSVPVAANTEIHVPGDYATIQAAGNATIVTVASSGADYTSLSAAFAGITDASIYKRYTVEVYGRVYENTVVTAKHCVDVIGFNAVIESSATGAGADDYSFIWGIGVTKWSNLILERRGTDTGYVGYFGLDVTRDTVMQNVTFANYQPDTTDGGCGVRTAQNASPTFINCTFKGGGRSYGYPFAAMGNSSPLLTGCIGIGATTGHNNHGFLIGEHSSATFISCIGVQGGGSANGQTTSYGFAVAVDLSSSVVMVNCLGTYKEIPATYTYRSASESFRPTSTLDHVVLSMIVLVKVPQAGKTVDIGATLGGSEIASAVSLATSGYQYFTFTRYTRAAGEYVYITPSGVIADNCFVIHYTWTSNYPHSYGLLLWTKGYVKISNSTFMSPPASPAACIYNWDASYTDRWSISNSTFETLGANIGTVALTEMAAGSVVGAPFRNCVFIGGKDATITLSDNNSGTATIAVGATGAPGEPAPVAWLWVSFGIAVLALILAGVALARR